MKKKKEIIVEKIKIKLLEDNLRAHYKLFLFVLLLKFPLHGFQKSLTKLYYQFQGDKRPFQGLKRM